MVLIFSFYFKLFGGRSPHQWRSAENRCAGFRRLGKRRQDANLAPADADLKKEIAALRRELAEALERQTATSEVLQVISSTPGDLEPVFQSLLENATRVCGAKFGSMLMLEGDVARQVALYNVPPAYDDSTERGHFDLIRKAALVK